MSGLVRVGEGVLSEGEIASVRQVVRGVLAPIAAADPARAFDLFREAVADGAAFISDYCARGADVSEALQAIADDQSRSKASRSAG